MPAKVANKVVSDKVGAKKANKTKGVSKPIVSSYILDCKGAVGTGLVLLPDLEKYILEKFKVSKGSKAGDLKGRVTIKITKDKKMHINSTEQFPKRYVKYLTKRFLCKMSVIDYFRIISTGPKSFEIRHYEDSSAAADEE